MNAKLDHLSYSSISSWLACGASWKYHYLDKVPTPTAPVLAFGSAFHNTVEEYVKNEHQGDLLALWQTNWNAQLEKETNIDWEQDTPDEYCNQGVRMFSNTDVQKGILSIVAASPEHIEKKVELWVPGVPIPIVGYIDIITADGVPGDLKTSSKSWTTDKALNELQPAFYLAALNQAGIPTPGNQFVHYIFVKTKTPQFQRIVHVHSESELFWLFKMIKSVWNAIDAGIFPLNPTGWKCSPQYCSYWAMCRGKS